MSTWNHEWFFGSRAYVSIWWHHRHPAALYTGTADGKVLKIINDSIEVLCQFGPGELCKKFIIIDVFNQQTLQAAPVMMKRSAGSRPLGMTLSPSDDHLWVIDAVLGLYTVNITNGKSFLLMTDLYFWNITGEFRRKLRGDQPMGRLQSKFLNDVTISPTSGKVYISDTSSKWRRSEFFYLALETNFPFFEISEANKMGISSTGSWNLTQKLMGSMKCAEGSPQMEFKWLRMANQSYFPIHHRLEYLGECLFPYSWK